MCIQSIDISLKESIYLWRFDSLSSNLCFKNYGRKIRFLSSDQSSCLSFLKCVFDVFVSHQTFRLFLTKILIWVWWLKSNTFDLCFFHAVYWSFHLSLLILWFYFSNRSIFISMKNKLLFYVFESSLKEIWFDYVTQNKVNHTEAEYDPNQNQSNLREFILIKVFILTFVNFDCQNKM